jgi:hypothetical protein
VVTESGIAGIADMMPSVLCAIGPRLHMASIIGKHIVFTGEPESMNRAEAEVLGAVVGSTVNAETDLLIDGPSDGSKFAAGTQVRRRGPQRVAVAHDRRRSGRQECKGADSKDGEHRRTVNKRGEPHSRLGMPATLTSGTCCQAGDLG